MNTNLFLSPWRKLLRRTSFLIVMLFLVFSNGFVLSQSTTTITLIPNRANTGNTTSGYVSAVNSFTNSGVDWKIINWNPTSLQLRGNQSAVSSNFQLSNTSAIPGSIRSVTIVRSGGTFIAANIDILTGTSEQTAVSGGTAGTTSGSNVKWTFTGNDTFFKIYFKNGATSGTATITSILIEYDNIPKYTLTYNGNGNTGGGVPAAVTQSEGTTIEVASSGDLIKSGYNFAGWNTLASGEGIAYTEGSIFTFTQNATLFAQWAASGSPALMVSGDSSLGATCIDVPISRAYTINNNGGVDATNITISSSNPNFNVSNVSSTTVVAGGDVTFTLTYASLQAENASTILTINNDELATATYGVSAITNATVLTGVYVGSTATEFNTKATLFGGVSILGVCVPTVIEKGFVYSKKSDNALPVIGGANVNQHVVSSENITIGDFSYEATGLTPSTEYVYRAYVYNGVDYIYSDTIAEFTTRAIADKLVFKSNALPATLATIGSSIQSFVVQAIRSSDNSVDKEFNGNVELKSNPEGFISGVLEVTSVAGEATFNGVTFTSVGNYTLEVASGDLATATSAPIEVNINQTIAPVAVAASGITSSSFVANWESVNGATDYELDVMVSTEAEASRVENFENGLPSGYGSATNVVLSSGTWNIAFVLKATGSNAYAGSSGSAQLQASNGILISPSFNKLKKVTFYAKKSSGNINVSKIVNGVEVNLDTNKTIASNFTKYEYDINEASSDVKFKIKNNSGAAYIDNFTFDYYDGSSESIVGYPINVGNVTSYVVEELNPDSNYRYLVRAKSGSVTTVNSNVISVKTLQGELAEVIFHKNDGSNETDSQTSLINVEANLKANAFVREGFIFKGWNTLTDGLGVAYQDEAIYDFSADLELFAQWEEIKYPSLALSGEIALGEVCIGGDLSAVYTIANTGEGIATAVSVTSSNPKFVVGELSSTTLEKDEEVTFTLTYTSTIAESASTVLTVTTAEGITTEYNVSAITALATSAPIAISATDVTKNSLVANWEAVEGVSNYELDVYKSSGSSVTGIEEIFDWVANGTTNGTGGNSGGWSGSVAAIAFSESDLGSSGWTVIRGYKGNGSAKFGTSSAKGILVTPAFGEAGDAVLTFRAGAWSGDSSELVLNIIDGGTLSASSVTMLNASFSDYVINITGATANTKISFEGKNNSSSRFFLDDIKIVVGSSVKEYIKQNEQVSDANNYSIENLTPNTRYGYVVRAISDLGCVSIDSNEILVTTERDAIVWENGQWSNGTGPDGDVNVTVNELLELPANGLSNLTVNDLEVGPSGSVVLGDGAKLTVNGNINAPNAEFSSAAKSSTKGIVIFDGASLTQTNNNAVNSGKVLVYKDVAMRKMDYTFWSSPVSGQALLNTSDVNGDNSAGGFSEGTPNNRIFTYKESNDTFIATTDADFIPGKGYAIRGKSTYGETDKTTDELSFLGELNNGLVSTTIQKSKNTGVNSDVAHGYNLIGNPYASNLDLEKFFLSNSNVVNTKAWFWSNVTPVLTQEGSSYEGNNYATWTGTGGVAPDYDGSIGDTTLFTPSDFVSVGQGFIVESKASAPSSDVPVVSTVSFDDSMRSNEDAVFFKQAGKNRFWLTMTSPEKIVNNILIGYIDGATKNYDADYDAELLVEGQNSLYTVLGARKLQIQGVNNNFSSEDVFTLGAKFKTDGTYKIALGKREGLFANNQKIFLRDKLTNVYTDLTEATYEFAAENGVDQSRFEIVFANKQTLASSDVKGDKLQVYKQGSDFVVRSSKDITNVEVYDMSGKIVNQINVKSKEVRVSHSKLLSNAYILKIYRDNEIITHKIIK